MSESASNFSKFWLGEIWESALAIAADCASTIPARTARARQRVTQLARHGADAVFSTAPSLLQVIVRSDFLYKLD